MRGIRRLARLYTLISSIAAAAALGCALFLAAAVVAVPEWVALECRDASAALGRAPEILGLVQTPSEGAAGTASSPSPDGPPLASSTSSTREPSPTTAPGADSKDRPESYPRETLESTIDRLEGDVVLFRAVPGPMTMAERASIIAARLEAWESVRAPLLACLSRWTEGGTEAPLPDPRGDIRTIGGALSRSLERLARPTQEEKEDDVRHELVAGLDGRAFAHLLLDDRHLSDKDAIECLLVLPRREAGAALSWLSRLDPARASRLVVGLKAGSREKETSTAEWNTVDARGTAAEVRSSGSDSGTGSGSGSGSARRAPFPELIADS